MKRISSILILILACSLSSIAREFSDNVEILYRQSHSDVDLNFDVNRQGVDSLVKRLRLLTADDSLFTLHRLKLVGTASPEGTVAYNNYLSQRRADGLLKFVGNVVSLPKDIDLSFDYVGRNWIGLYELVEADENVPSRSEVLDYLATVLNDLFAGNPDSAEHLDGLKRIDGGRAYDYMYRTMFPGLRSSIMYMDYTFAPYERMQQLSAPDYTMAFAYSFPNENILPVAMRAHKSKNFYMGLKTNMLYDALALPSIGAEFYLGKNFSVVGNWTYGWWDTDSRHRYWRAYGGDIALRWWFGSKANAKPLTGHHIGVYGGAFTYDFEFGGRGYMGGKPKHSLWDKCLLNCGVEYGYSLPVSRRLNIDFTIGLGYISGQYYEYIPQDGHYVWQSTHNLNWFGPAKAEISLVWLIGNGNYNSKKGGRL